MKEIRFSILFAVMLIIQLILTKYGQLGFMISISILPAMILCMPTSRPTWWVLIVAFLSGLVVDGLSDGPLGLNAAALVPVAAMQKPFIRLFIDDDLVTRHYNFSFYQNGVIKVGLALLAETLIFMICYTLADCAGTRSGGFIFTKILLSTVASMIIGLLVCNVLSPRTKR